jgi:endonuclease/exonuclease/phosphatase family metal-dependent hydrolase
MKFYTLFLAILFISTQSRVRVAAPPCADYPLQVGKSSHVSKSTEPGLTVVSLNMAKEERSKRIFQDLKESSLFKTADVWLLQEATGAAPEVARELGLHYAYAPAERVDHDTMSGLAILSRYPIDDSHRVLLPHYKLLFNTSCRIALSARVRGPAGPVRVLNAHLDTRITQEQRLQQAGALFNLERDRVPIVIGGDFNTSNIRWIGSLLPIPGQNHAGAMRKLFEGHGFTSPFDGRDKTFKLLGLPLQLDWIFTKRLKTVASGTENIPFSDHNAVWADLR